MSLTKIDDRGLKTPIDLQDNEKIRLGTGNDLEIYHNGTFNIIDSANDFDLKIMAGSDTMAIFDTNGAVELYHDNSKKFETTSSGATVTGQFNVAGVLKFDNNVNSGLDIRFEPSTNSLDFVDNVKARFGTGDDLEIYHDGSNSYIKDSGTGGLLINSSGFDVLNAADNEFMGRFIQDGAVQLYHNGSLRLATDANGVAVTTNVSFPDNGVAVFGAGSDLQISHDGTDSKIEHTTSGTDLIIKTGSSADDVIIQPQDDFLVQVAGATKNSIISRNDGATELYWQGSSAGKKLSTISDGIEVHGSTDSARIEFNDAYSNSRIGYFGLNRFGIDAHDGLEIRDPSDSYATRLMIDASGRLLLGDTSPTTGTSTGHIVSTFNGNADNGLKTRDTSGAGSVNHCVFVSQSTAVGSITGSSSSISYSNLSDYRTKENVTAISDGITRLKTLKPSRFNFKVDKDTTVDGFLAHEVTPAVPEAVTGEKDAVDSNGKINPQMLDSSKLVPLLTAALQEEISKREALETRVAALEAA